MPNSSTTRVANRLVLECNPCRNDEPEVPWLLTMRERLRAKFLRALESAARCLDRTHQHDQAVACYEKALDIEPLAESLYCGLMRVRLAQGQRAEALAVYERCRRVLKSQLGIEPSGKTQSLLAQCGGVSAGEPQW